jgi:hypothetical protein
VTSLTLVREVGKVGLHHSVVEGLSLAVTVVEGLIMVVLHGILETVNMQAT